MTRKEDEPTEAAEGWVFCQVAPAVSDSITCTQQSKLYLESIQMPEDCETQADLVAQLTQRPNSNTPFATTLTAVCRSYLNSKEPCTETY